MPRNRFQGPAKSFFGTQSIGVNGRWRTGRWLPRDKEHRSKWGTFTLTAKADPDNPRRIELDMHTRLEKPLVEPAEVSVFVRDRGKGFDPETVPADRKGLAESVRARMARRGGNAAIRSTPGEGTEVSLTMPRNVTVRPSGTLVRATTSSIEFAILPRSSSSGRTYTSIVRRSW